MQEINVKSIWHWSKRKPGGASGDKGLTCIFSGEINSVGKAGGVHHISAIRDGTARILPGKIRDLGKGFYKAEVEVWNEATGKYLKKEDPSTFFPDWMSEEIVMQEIKSARDNMIGTFSEITSSYQRYFGKSSMGNRIHIVRTPPFNNNIFTAYYQPL